MTALTKEERIRCSRQLAVLTHAFRPMFLAAGIWAIVAIALWLAVFFGYLYLPTRFDPLAWHIHEMLFGFVMAAGRGVSPDRYFRTGLAGCPCGGCRWLC